MEDDIDREVIEERARASELSLIRSGHNTGKSLITDIVDFAQDNDVPLLDAVIEYAERHELDVEAIAAALRRFPALKAQIQEEAEGRGLVEKTSRLPV